MKNLLCCLVVAAALAPLGCKSAKKIPVTQTVEESAALASVVHTGDPKTGNQLVNGFYGIEDNAWRWSAQKFSVSLRPPLGSAQRGAILELAFTVPQTSIDQLKTVTLSASMGGESLPPETYNHAGTFTYRQEVAAKLLTVPAVRVDFQLDKAMKPGGADQRDLGLVVLSAGLVAK